LIFSPTIAKSACQNYQKVAMPAIYPFVSFRYDDPPVIIPPLLQTSDRPSAAIISPRLSALKALAKAGPSDYNSIA
jgi:hypothetical protein